MTDFKKGGPLQNSNIYATNRLFVKNPLFKKRKKKRAPGVYNPKAKFKYEDGGSIMDLTEEEIQKYIDGGYVVEEVNDPSIPALTKAAKGGTKKGCPEGHYWDGTKCTKLITLKNDKKYIDGVANWAMHVSDPNMISGDYNDQIKDRLYSGKWGLDPETGALVKLSAVQPKSVTTVDAKTKASREKEKLAEKNYRAEEENKKAYEQSIIDAGFDPATFGKAKGINTITGEPIYASSKEEAERKNQEAINQAAIEGHAAVVNNPVFKAGAYMTPVGMAIGAMEGLARFIPDATTLAQDPTLANAGQLGLDALQALPIVGKPLASATGKAFNSVKNLEDLQAAKVFAEKYGYDFPLNLERIAESNSLTDKTIRGLMNRHNTFARGVSTDWNILAERNPEILQALKNKGFDLTTEAGSKAAAEYMATHIPEINTGGGRVSLNNNVFNEGLDALYTSNSLGTAEGYTYGNGYIYKVKKPTDFSSLNRQDWITKNDPKYYNWHIPKDYNLKNQNNVFYNIDETNILKTEHHPIPFKEQFPHKINITDTKTVLKGLTKNHDDYTKHVDEITKINNDIFNKHTPQIDEAHNKFVKFMTGKREKDLTPLEKETYNLLIENENKLKANLKNELDKINRDYLKTHFKNWENSYDPYAHYIHLGKPGEKLLDPIQSWKINLENWKNQSRAHKGIYSKKFSKLEKGGSTDDYIEVDIPEEEIQWYIDNGYRVEPVTKLKKFIG